MRDCNLGAVLGGFLAGAIVGGAIALLYAPRTGAETRGLIRDFVEDEIDTVKDKAAAARDFIEAEVEAVKKAATTTRRRAHKTA